MIAKIVGGVRGDDEKDDSLDWQKKVSACKKGRMYNIEDTLHDCEIANSVDCDMVLSYR